MIQEFWIVISNNIMQNLVIVESPTKARTLQRFLGKNYQIEASMGHIRDLPKSEFGVDTQSFEPKYIIPRAKKKKANELKKLAGSAKTIWLASDPDREGEAIAWHIKELLVGSSESKLIQRVVFHEITEEAIKEAFNHPREIDLKLVDAQQARRILDRLVGYKLSPLLWQKVKRGLSAGRVQSVALRLIAERQREIDAFKPVEYWIVEAQLKDGETFLATLIELNGKKLVIKNEEEAKGHVAALEKAKYQVFKIAKKTVKRYPYPPFTTSTLQQAASNRLGFSAKKTMSLAQNLYEHGLITYMRTDSVNLAPSAVSATRDYIKKFLGKSYLPQVPRAYKSKSKNAQEAHEAIRPTKVDLLSSHIKDENGLVRDHARLYELIWKRFVASQMNEALVDQTSVDIKAIDPSLTAQDELRFYLLRSTGSVIRFDGWLKLYQSNKYQGEEEQEKGSEGKILPELNEDEDLKLEQLLPTQHFTEPPPSFNEASLIKKMEELEIGRPSTYAPILSTIQERFYVERIDRKFIPTLLGLTVIDFLVKYFPDIVDYSFTAQMEDELDEIARGERAWQPTMKAFYGPFEKKLEETEGRAEKIKMEVEKVDKVCPECGKGLVVRFGKFGKFLACSGFPECKHTEAFEDVSDARCPTDGGDIVIRHTKAGKTFYGCKNWPDCKFASWTKPKIAS